MFNHKFKSYFTLWSCTFYFFKLFGMATMALNTKSFKDNRTNDPILMYSKLGILYNLILLFAVTTSSIFSAVHLYKADYSLNFERIIDAVQNSFGVFICVTVLIIFCIRQNAMIDVASTINSIRTSMSVINDDLQNSKKNSLRKEVVIICFIVNPISWFMLVITSSNNSLGIFFFNFAIHLTSVFIMNVLVTLYIIVLKCIKSMFEFVNRSLEEITSQSEALNEMQFVNLNVNKLSHLRKTHYKLSNATYDVSMLFSLPMLLCSFHNFIMLILSAFFIAKWALFGQNFYSWQLNLHYLCHLVSNLLPLVILTQTVSDTIFESKRTGKILSSLDIFKNEKIEDSIKLFLSYLPHSNVQFKVYDLFSLNQSLLMSFVGSITTYLVILLQFEK